jgi:hypothetical protein
MFIDACATGTHLGGTTTGTDDGHTPAQTLPFAFPLYGVSSTTLSVDTNGYAVLGSTPIDSFAATLPLTSEGRMVAPFFDDLTIQLATSDICVSTVGTMPSRRYVIEWQHASRYSHALVDITFEAILNESDSSIDFIYSSMLPVAGTDSDYANGMHAAIGLQNAGGTLTSVHTGTISTTTGIHWAPM